ncbi:hypothetical protein DL96DRAFT_1717123 [Flagelloscypha sp. PMI_526]|nr:hypothetical protein DL96DRAFT_1717123 [Flagelloscypha sp. PMI_526]
MNNFPDLPLDIVGLIATTALKSGALSGRALSHVSRSIQILVDPLLFRNMKFNSYQLPKSYITSQSERLTRIRPFVWSFEFDNVIALDDFQEIVSLHPNIKFLLFHSIMPSVFKSVPIPSLTHLSADFHFPFGAWHRRDGPLFANLTHLDLRMIMYSSIPNIASDLSQIPSLKAVIVGGGKFRGQSFEDVPRALATLPSTLDLIVIWFSKWKLKSHVDIGTSGERMITGEMDSRVIVSACFRYVWNAPPHCVAMTRSIQYALWDYWRSPGENVWAAARAIQKSRMTGSSLVQCR